MTWLASIAAAAQAARVTAEDAEKAQRTQRLKIVRRANDPVLHERHVEVQETAKRGCGLIRLFKWALLALCAGWAAYSLWAVSALSQMFRSAPHERIPPLTDFLAGLQIAAVTVGPLLVAAIFLALPWPRRNSN